MRIPLLSARPVPVQPRNVPGTFSLRSRMGRFCRTMLLAALLCIPAIPCATPQAGESPRGRAVHCYDGDTLKLADGRKVRLLGIDTPEVAHGDSPAQFYAAEATALLQQTVRGRELSLRAAGGQDRDHYKRLLADVRLEDGSSVNQLMVREGAAFVYMHKDNDPDYVRTLLQLQREAMQAGRGMWGPLKTMPAWRARYVGNRNSHRFFPEGCAAAGNINPRNRVTFNSLGAAFEAGFAPARICPFWPDAGDR